MALVREVSKYLIVDDEPDVRDVLASHLRRLGFAVTLAAYGMEGKNGPTSYLELARQFGRGGRRAANVMVVIEERCDRDIRPRLSYPPTHFIGSDFLRIEFRTSREKIRRLLWIIEMAVESRWRPDSA